MDALVWDNEHGIPRGAMPEQQLRLAVLQTQRQPRGIRGRGEPKELRFMTRRRFIRLLMAKRISRNVATKYAKRVQGSGLPYAVAYSRFFLVDFEVTGGAEYQVVIKRANRAVKSLAENLGCLHVRALTREEHETCHEFFRRNREPYILTVSTAGCRADWLPAALIGWDLINEKRWEKKNDCD